jgi:hypothetical protein
VVHTRSRARLEGGAGGRPPELSLAVGETAVGAGAAAPAPPQRAQLRLVRRPAEGRRARRIRAPASVPLPHPLPHGSWTRRTATPRYSRDGGREGEVNRRRRMPRGREMGGEQGRPEGPIGGPWEFSSPASPGEAQALASVGSTLELGFASLPFALDPFAATEAIK